HSGAIDVGLIPSIEYLRGGPYRIVPDLAIASHGPVASVTLLTSKPMADVRSIAMDTSSRTSVALVRVLCARLFQIAPAFEARGARAVLPVRGRSRRRLAGHVIQAARVLLMSIATLSDRVRAGGRLAADEALELYRSASTALLGQLADAARARKHPDRIVTY